MNNQARSCKLKCKYNIQGICHAYGECIAKDLFIAEFEKIKAEIRTIPQVHIKTGTMSLDKELVVPLNKVIEKLDNRIAELKGENK